MGLRVLVNIKETIPDNQPQVNLKINSMIVQRH